MITLSDLCGELRNYFTTAHVFGNFTVTDGRIDLDNIVPDGSLQTGQFFRIVGSIFNDGIYKYPATELVDETFNGAIWTMAVPADVIRLLDDINTWDAKYADALDKPYTSESFGGYSYSIKGKFADETAGADAWKKQFASRLNRWRKIRA